MRNKYMSDEQERMEDDISLEYSQSFIQDEFTGRLITQTVLDELQAKLENERFFVSLPSHIQGY